MQNKSLKIFKTLLVLSFIYETGCATMKPSPIDPGNLELPQGPLAVVQQTEDPAVRQKNSLYLPNRRVQAVEFGSEPLLKLVAEMHATMAEKKGIGIAANQIGKNIQIFMIEAKADNPRYKVLGTVPYTVFINPKIVRASSSKNNFWHGCLSAEGKKRGDVATYDWIDVEAQDPSGKWISMHLSGLASVIFQHEFRHLLGGTYLDRATIFLEKEELDKRVANKEVNFFGPADESLPLLIGDYRIGETLEEYYGANSIN